jgi:tetratricopeptide (TPR) repeat protein/DNA polymerase III delta prime subunit
MAHWSIPTAQLTGPRRLGGRASKRGFEFQDTYTCLQLTYLLDSSKGVQTIRPEGAQDIDLLYTNGYETYIQLKHEPDKRYTLASLCPILQSFAVDFIEAGAPPTLTFCLIARSNNLDHSVSRLRDGKQTEDDLIKLSMLLTSDKIGSLAPKCLQELAPADLRRLIEQLLNQTRFEFGMGDRISERFSFESHACNELARRGISGSDLQSAFATLMISLNTNREFNSTDVERILSPYFGRDALSIFRGRVEMLDDDILSRTASLDRVSQYYAGARLGWDILSANGDISRDQQVELLDALSLPHDGLRVFCILGEPGAGKSTLAWRVAKELHARNKALVLRVKDAQNPDVWYLMSEFIGRVHRPIFVLVDDLFRSPTSRRALQELDASLPLTIIGTSRMNEFRLQRLDSGLTPLELKPPSHSEKTRVLRRFNKTTNDLTREEQRRFDSASQFLVLMLELTHGQGLHEIVRESIEWLHSNDRSTYQAYEYLCFAYQYGISVPRSLLERLDCGGYFYNLANRSEARGLVVCDDEQVDHIRVGHSLLAAAAYDIYRERRAPLAVLKEFVFNTDLNQQQERMFLARLFEALANSNADVLKNLSMDIQTVLIKCHPLGSLEELYIWQAFYRRSKLNQHADFCIHIACDRAPETLNECGLLLDLYRKYGKGIQVLEEIRKWMKGKIEDPNVRQSYLSFLSEYGPPDELEKALRQTEVWLRGNPEDKMIRSHYLGILQKHGTKRLVDTALQKTRKWFLANPDDTQVRVNYMRTVESRGTESQFRGMLMAARRWLAEHPDDTVIRQLYLNLAARKGTLDQKRRILEELTAWLDDHPEAKMIYACLLAVARTYATPEQAQDIIQKVSHWLLKNESDEYVMCGYLNIVERKGTRKQIEDAFEQIETWLNSHPKDMMVRSRLIEFAQHKGSPQRVAQIYKQTKDWLARSLEDQGIRPAILSLVRDRGTEELKLEAMLETRTWLVEHPEATSVWISLVSLLATQNTEDSFETVCEGLRYHPGSKELWVHYIHLAQGRVDQDEIHQHFQRVVSLWPEDTQVRSHYANWLRDNGYEADAERLYNALITSKTKNTPHYIMKTVHYGYGLLLFQTCRYQEAIDQFFKTLIYHKRHTKALEKLNLALREIALHEFESDDPDRQLTRVFNKNGIYYPKYWYHFENPSRSLIYSNLGWYYILHNLSEQATDAFMLAIEVIDDVCAEPADNQWAFGCALLGLKRYEQALAVFHEMLNGHSNRIEYYDEIEKLATQWRIC